MQEKNNKLFHLKERLYKCSLLIKNDSILDIGSDHAYLPIWLYRNSIIKKAIAADIRIHSVKLAAKNIKTYNAQTGVEARLSNGFENIKSHEAEDIIISGLGSNTIIDIIKKCNWDLTDKRLILQPSSPPFILRKFLVENGYKILQESPIIEKTQHNVKYYVVILAEFTKNIKKYDRSYHYLGEILKTNDVKNLKLYLIFLLNEINKKRTRNEFINITEKIKKYLNF